VRPPPVIQDVREMAVKSQYEIDSGAGHQA